MKDDCVKVLGVLSDYRDGSLDDPERTFVHVHIGDCPPCKGLFEDLDLIVVSARGLASENGINYPDENVIWQRMAVIKPPVH